MTLRASSLGGTVRLVCRLRADRPEAAAPRRPPRRESLSLLLSSLRRSPLARAAWPSRTLAQYTLSPGGADALSRAQHASRTRDHWPRAADTSLWELSFFFFFFPFQGVSLRLRLCPCLASASRPLGRLSLSRVCSRANSSSSLFLVLALILSSSRPRHGVASNSRTPRRESCSCRRAHLLNYAHHPPSRRTIVGGAVQCGAVRYGTMRCGAVR